MAYPSKFQNLLAEILSNIFFDCLDDRNLPRIRQNAAPLSVSHVCRHWRNVSISQKRLWAKIWLKCTTNTSTVERALPALQMFLSRSGGIDFRVEVDCMSDVPDGLDPVTTDHRRECRVKEPQIKALLTELSIHSERIKGITLAMPWIRFLIAVRFVARILPELDQLIARIYHNSRVPQQMLSTSFDDFTPMGRLGSQFWETACGLESLEITSHQSLTINSNMLFRFPNPQASESHPVVFSKLRHLALNTVIHTSVLLLILRNSPVLETLYVSPGITIGHFEDDTPLSLPSVLSLQYTAGKQRSPNRQRQVLQLLRLSNLRRFVLRDFTGIESVLESFLNESRPPLEELCLIEGTLTSFDEAPIVRVLMLLPGLKKLRIPLHLGVLRALVLSDSETENVCPLLEEVTFDILEMTKAEETWDAAKDMIRSRLMAPIRSGATTVNSSEIVSTSTSWNRLCLRKINLPGVQKEDWKTHQLYVGIKDCQSEDLIIGFEDPDPLPIRTRW